MIELHEIKEKTLVYDIETSSKYNDGRVINIQTDFEGYVHFAKIKWVGAYSYKYKKEYCLNMNNPNDYKIAVNLFEEHSILVGFNSINFDFPILQNNYIINKDKYFIHVDNMQILGNSTFKDKNGFSFKGRGKLMGYKLKNNKLKTVAEAMGLEFQKGDIDYKIFEKDSWNEVETKEIITYLRADFMSTKGMFDKLWEYWKPFTEYLDQKSIKNLSWIRSSIASLTYKSACFAMNTEPTYSDGGKQEKEKMGGYVLDPVVEEADDIFYVDWSGLYPHIFTMFNLFSETTEKNGRDVWHGNDVFKVKGFYDISEQHILSKTVKERLKERIELKKSDPTNPKIYTLKIWLNALYGCVRSAIFEKVHTPNAGYDCCSIGQQMNKLVKDMFETFGFKTIYQDTDSSFIYNINKDKNTRENVKICIEKIVAKVLHNVPFPVETFNMDIENFLSHIMFPFSDQELVDDDTRKSLNAGEVDGYLKTEKDGKKVIIEEATGKIVKKGRSWVKTRRGKKKNYAFIYEDKGEKKIKLVGLPIKKDNSTKLGPKIYEEVLKPIILKTNKAKFSKKFIDDTVSEYLKDKEILKLMAVEYKIKPYSSYKIVKGKTEATTIHAQISKIYFDGGDGIVNLIKNSKAGRVGKGFKYCTLEESIEAKLTVDDLDTEKLYNELGAFIKYEKIT